MRQSSNFIELSLNSGSNRLKIMRCIDLYGRNSFVFLRLNAASGKYQFTRGSFSAVPN